MKSFFYGLLSLFFMLGSIPGFAQIGIGTKTPAASAALEVSSTANNKGILIPRLSASQKDAIVSPAEGLLVYQTTAPIGFYYYTGTAWKLMAIQTDLTSKVDKVDGKDLSTNDYTTAEKTKLAAVTGSNTGDQTTITGNAGTATKLAASKNINGVAFDGTADIIVPAAAETLTGIVAIANGGTNSTALATAGGIGYGTGTAHAYTGAGTSGQLLSSNGAGVPTWITPSSGGIPYTGAATAVNLGAYDLKVNSLTVGKGSGGIATNTATGMNALQNNTIGANNIAAGYEALKSNTIGYSNAAFGGSALTSNTIGFYNTALGKDALRKNIAGLENTGVGLSSLYSNNDGSYNTAVGSSSLDENTSGEYNTAMGRQALSSTTTGSNNVAVGAAALNTNITGANNTAIGYAADVASAALNNATAIGAGAIVSSDNTIQLGNTSVTNVKTSGTIAAGAVTYPNTDGAIGQVLTANANGVLTWAAASTNVSGIVALANGGTGSATQNFVDLTTAQIVNGNKTLSGNTTVGGALTGNSTGVSTIAGFSANLINSTATAYTLSTADNGKIISFSSGSPITLTVPNSLIAGFNCMIVQLGAGEVTLTASGTTISNRSSFTKTAGTNAILTLIAMSSTSFISAGDMK